MTYVTNLTHYLGEDGIPDPGAPARFVSFQGDIVACASAHGVGKTVYSSIQCRRRPGRKPCHGHLAVMNRADGAIEWLCPECGDDGFISGWQGTIWDHSESLAEAEPDGKLTLLVSAEEHGALKEMITLSPETEAIISSSIETNQGFELTGSLNDFDEMLDEIAAETNHSKLKKTQRVLDGIYDRLEELIQGN